MGVCGIEPKRFRIGMPRFGSIFASYLNSKSFVPKINSKNYKSGCIL